MKFRTRSISSTKKCVYVGFSNPLLTSLVSSWHTMSGRSKHINMLKLNWILDWIEKWLEVGTYRYINCSIVSVNTNFSMTTLKSISQVWDGILDNVRQSPGQLLGMPWKLAKQSFCQGRGRDHGQVSWSQKSATLCDEYGDSPKPFPPPSLQHLRCYNGHPNGKRADYYSPKTPLTMALYDVTR